MVPGAPSGPWMSPGRLAVSRQRASAARPTSAASWPPATPAALLLARLAAPPPVTPAAPLPVTPDARRRGTRDVRRHVRMAASLRCGLMAGAPSLGRAAATAPAPPPPRVAAVALRRPLGPCPMTPPPLAGTSPPKINRACLRAMVAPGLAGAKAARRRRRRIGVPPDPLSAAA
nr:atherin-like [Aegilops tauschii subsp. strangulata]